MLSATFPQSAFDKRVDDVEEEEEEEEEHTSAGGGDQQQQNGRGVHLKTTQPFNNINHFAKVQLIVLWKRRQVIYLIVFDTELILIITY